MEIPRLLPARQTLRGGVTGSSVGNSPAHGRSDQRAGQVAAGHLLLLRGPQDGGPGRQRSEALEASQGPGPSTLALRPDYAVAGGGGGGGGGGTGTSGGGGTGTSGGGGTGTGTSGGTGTGGGGTGTGTSGGGGTGGTGSGTGGGDEEKDFFLVLLDPVGGDLETVGAGQATGPMWRGVAEPGLGLRGGETSVNPLSYPALGPCCSSSSAIPTLVPDLVPNPSTGLGLAKTFSGTVTIHNQDLLLRFDNGIGILTLATPLLPASQPGAMSVSQPGGLITAPQARVLQTAQLGNCPELPPDLLIEERTEPTPTLAPEEEMEGQAASENSGGSLGPGPGIVLYMCPEAQCGQTFPKKHQLKVHLLTHSSTQGQRPFKCPLSGCGWTFTTSYKLKRHLQSHDKLRPFGCPTEGCGKSFTTVYNLKAHMKGHEQENSFKCEVCEESFPTQAKLSAHQRSHFEPERPYQCAFSGCKKTFITVSALFSHNRAHFREQELFSCSFPGCSKQYDKACRLKIHLRSHTGERPFLCDFDGCGWNFTSMSKLLRHKRKHDDDRRFMCPVEGCGKSFTRAEHLKGHSITHLGTKPFVCPVEGCRARFSARSSLYIHSKKHLQDVDTWKSRCPVSTCNKLFTSKHSMKAHMAKRHNLHQDIVSQLDAANSLTPSSALTCQGQSDTSDAELVSLFSDASGGSSAALLDTALVNSGILTIDVASMSSTLAGNLPANNTNTLGHSVDPRALMTTSDLPQNLDISLFFGATPAGFQQNPLDVDDVPGLQAGPLGPLGSLCMKSACPEPQALTPSSKLTVDPDPLTPSSSLCENSVSELLMQTKEEWNKPPDSDFFGQEEETQFGFSSATVNHSSQKETDLITVTDSSFLV